MLGTRHKKTHEACDQKAESVRRGRGRVLPRLFFIAHKCASVRRRLPLSRVVVCLLERHGHSQKRMKLDSAVFPRQIATDEEWSRLH